MNKMNIYSDIKQKVLDLKPDSAFGIIVKVMEVLETYSQLDGKKKEEKLFETLDKFVSESDVTNVLGEDRLQQLVDLKNNSMVKPYIDMICKASKNKIKINKNNFFDGKWCNCISLKS